MTTFLINSSQERRRLNRLVRLVELERLETTLVSLRERLVDIQDNSDTENVVGDGGIPVSSNDGAAESYIEDDMSVAGQSGMEHNDEVLCPITSTLFKNADFEHQKVTDSNQDDYILEIDDGTRFSEEKICWKMDGDLHCLEQVMDAGDIIEENNSQKTFLSPDHSMKEKFFSDMTDIKRQSVRSFVSDKNSVQESEVAQNCHDVTETNKINKQRNHILSENGVPSAAKYLANSTLSMSKKKAITIGVNSHSDDNDGDNVNDNDMLSVSDTEDVVTAPTVQTETATVIVVAAAGARALDSRKIVNGVMEALLPGDLQSGDPEVFKEIAGQADTDFTTSTSTSASTYGLQAELVAVAADQADVEVEVEGQGLGRILEQGEGEEQHAHVEVEVMRNQNVNAPIPIQVIADNPWNDIPAIQLYWFIYDIYFGEPRDNARGPRRDIDEIDFFPLDFSKFFSNHLQVILVTSFFGFMLLLTLTVPILSMNYLGINGQLFVVRRYFISRCDIYKLHIPMPHTAASAAWWKENCEDADFLYSLFFVYAFSALVGE